MDNDRIIVMHKGEIVEHGSPSGLYEHGQVFKELVDESGLSAMIRS